MLATERGDFTMLVLRRKDEDAAICSIGSPRITVGRDISNDVVLEDASVSGFHAVLFHDDGRYTVADLGSTNGSFVNAKRVSGRTEFSDGDRLSFGTVICDVGDSVPRRRETVVMKAIQVDTEASVKSTAKLRLISGEGHPAQVTVGTSLAVGRSSGNELVLDSDMVSGRHALITMVDGGADLVDNGSTNGTYVNGERISHRRLRHGDHVRFDTIEYVFEMPENELRATRVNPVVQAEMVLTKVATLARELPKQEPPSPLSPRVTDDRLEPFVPPLPARSAPPVVNDAPVAKTSIQPVVSPPAPESEVEVPHFLRDEDPVPGLNSTTSDKPSPGNERQAAQSLSDYSIRALVQMAFLKYVEWLPALAIIACGTILQVWLSFRTIGNGTALNLTLALAASLIPFAGVSVLAATSAKKLGYGIDSAFDYGMRRCLPLFGAGTVLGLILVMPILVFAGIGYIGASIAGSQAAGALLIIPGYLVSLYFLLRLWPLMVMAITDRDALAVRSAWRLTGSEGAFAAATGPILGWWILPSVVTIPLSVYGGIPGYVIAVVISVFFVMPVIGLLVVSRYMRLHTLSQASLSGSSPW